MLYLPKDQLHLEKAYRDIINHYINKTDNLHYFINRVKAYNSNGRHQTEEQANTIAEEFKEKLENEGLMMIYKSGDIHGYDQIVEKVLKELNNEFREC